MPTSTHSTLKQTAARYAQLLSELGHTHTYLPPASAAWLRQPTTQKQTHTPSTKAPSPSLNSQTTHTGTHLPPLTGNKEIDLAELSKIVLPCTRCPHLVRARNKVVFGVGNPNARLLFIGEAPGADEDIQGEPFVGRAGELLTKMIEAMGLKRSDVFIANVLKCRPDMPAGVSGNRKPTHEEMKTCLPYLRRQIEIIRPRAMVTLGSTALEGLTGAQRITIGSTRGRWQDFEGIPFMPTFHPAYLLRNQTKAAKRTVWEDLLAVMERLELPIGEKQRGYFL